MHARGFKRACRQQEIGAHQEPWKSIRVFDEHHRVPGSIQDTTKSKDREA